MNHKATYEILAMGTLSERWAEWFQGMTIRQDQQNGASVTLVFGLVPDQSLANNEVNNAILPATVRPGAFAILIAIG